VTSDQGDTNREGHDPSADEDATQLTPSNPPPFSSDFDIGNLADSDGGDSLLGIVIGNYQIEELLGKGGFGAVYRARDVKLDRNVALKFLKEPLQEEHRTLFEREAKAIAALSKHPGIVQIYGWDEYQKYVFFALEYIPASTDKMLRRWPRGMPASWALQIVRDATAALGHAHNEGFLHRDIKPENILIDEEHRQVKLADFGLVSVVASEQPSILQGRISGSPPYMSPEQASGHVLDERADVYSMGVTLYRLLSGELPVADTSAGKILEKIRNDDRIPLRERRNDLSKDVYNLVERATAFRPEDRYQSCAEFIAAIESTLADAPDAEDFFEAATALVKNTTMPGRPLHGRNRWKVPALALAAVALIIIAASAFWSRPGGPGPIVSPVEAAVQLLEQGEYEAAEAKYEELLASGVTGDELLYGLGYARLNGRQTEAAEESFAQIQAAALSEEGMGAVAYAQKRDGFQQQLEAVASQYNSVYGKVLLAKNDLVAQKYDEVIARLEKIEENDLRFRWQYAQGLATLGQAYYKSGDDESAREIFQILAALPGSGGSAGGNSIAAVYLDMMKRKADVELRDKALARAKDLGERIKNGDVPVRSNEELWTSRPLRFLILPTDSGKSAYAIESGLADVLPELLGRTLDEHGRLDWVDRDELDVTLAEQELSSYLSSDANRVQLGMLLGARTIIEGRFNSLLGEETLTGKIVDSETTLRIPIAEIPVAGGLPPRDAVNDLAESVIQRIEVTYPLKARLQRDPDGLVIDIGGELAVSPGTQFIVLPEADIYAPPIADAVAIVEQITGAGSARVRMEGLTPDQVPDEGLYVIEESWYFEHGNGAT
jgi:tRNA A-37 threonylcarbamoyl transferase component Bud32/tetratricopeptide (TPR) repeat protein